MADIIHEREVKETNNGESSGANVLLVVLGLGILLLIVWWLFRGSADTTPDDNDSTQIEVTTPTPTITPSQPVEMTPLTPTPSPAPAQ